MATKLAALPETQRVSSRVIRVLGGNPGNFTLQGDNIQDASLSQFLTVIKGTNTYIVGTGAQRILIDTGEGRPSWIKALQDVLLKENAECLTVLTTHWHLDHVGGINHLLENLSPDAAIYKHEPGPNQRNIVNGDVFKVDGATIHAVHTPGHTSDHMALILEEEDAMFTGDNVLGHGTAVFEDLSTYLTSLEKMKDLFSGRAYPGHGPVIDDGRAKILEYIKHRQQREQQIIDILRTSNPAREISQDEDLGSWDSMDIVKIIYKDVPESLHLPAHGGVLQVLRKLEQEDKVAMDPAAQRWRINSRAAL